MPVSPAFQATVGEWRTILEALKHYQSYLEETVPLMETHEGLTDEGLIAYDHLERLGGILPKIQQQMAEYLQQFS